MLPTPKRCCYPGCTEFADHDHHITYEPEVIKPVCRSHHEQITIINGQQGRKYHRALSNKHRWWIWYRWLAGTMKGRRTRKALEYIKGWDRGSSVLTVVTPLQEAVPERSFRKKEIEINPKLRPVAPSTKKATVGKTKKARGQRSVKRSLAKRRATRKKTGRK
jgi:hypothetical protein